MHEIPATLLPHGRKHRKTPANRVVRTRFDECRKKSADIVARVIDVDGRMVIVRLNCQDAFASRGRRRVHHCKSFRWQRAERH